MTPFQPSTLFSLAFIPAIQLGVTLLLAPLVNMVLKKFKAFLQGRQGPPWLQGYYDLLKYFRKETVVSRETSWLFLATPVVVFASTCVASFAVPTFMANSPLQWLGGIILFVYLLGLGRFFTASAAMEPGSGFCGMASSREMMLASLIEPVLLLALFVIAILAGSTNFFAMTQTIAAKGYLWLSPAYLIAVIALLTASIAEIGRVPFDNPETHYELTMIHEGMLLEYSGKPLGLMFWSAWVKQLVILSLCADLIFPWGLCSWNSWGDFPPHMALGLLFYLLKLLLLCVIVALVETTIAKVRLFRVKDILGAAFVLGMIALILASYWGGVSKP
jgi:formate hydrogenlyase subunit 4